jgi:hypothetical protein
MEAASEQWRGFGEAHFGGCEFGDRRLTRRAVTTADAVMRHPGGTLPAKLAGNDLLGFYRLANNPKVTHAAMLAPHARATLAEAEAVAAGGVVLLISDTTEVDYTTLSSAAGELGQVGNGGGRGLLCHNVLAFDYAGRTSLGLVNQVMHRRRKVAKGETLKQKREHPGRESRLWKRALADVPPPPPGQVWVHVCDRGADTFENVDFWEGRGEKYDIRSKSNRKVVGPDGKRHRLHELARGLPRAAGRRTVRVSDNRGQPAREATVEVGFAAVTLPAPRQRRGEHGDQPHTAWVVHVREVDPPAGAAPLEWVLLTNVPVATAADAWERADWYACRPVIEEFHKALKTGCGVEDLQFTTRHALEVAIALLSVVATRLLRLRDLSRDDRTKDRPAADVLDPVYVEVLSAVRFKRRRPLTVLEFCLALAWLGGHLNRKSDRPPGWLVLWRGWTKLQQMVAAVEADRAARCV